jgi:hypothetical protein
MAAPDLDFKNWQVFFRFEKSLKGAVLFFMREEEKQQNKR